MENEILLQKPFFAKLAIAFVAGIVITVLVILAFMTFTGFSRPKVLKTEKTLGLTLTSPTNFVATTQKTLAVSGHTGIKSIVTISLGKQSKIVETSGDHFSVDLELSEGKNKITIVAFNKNTGEALTQTREILYLNFDLANL